MWFEFFGQKKGIYNRTSALDSLGITLEVVNRF